MSTSEARILANPANSPKSIGSQAPESREKSRASSSKPGLTYAGVVMLEQDAAEVERLERAFRDELKPPGEVGRHLVKRMAILSVRMDRAARQETAALAARVRRALDEFEAPEGVDAATLEELRAEIAGVALFDASKEGTLARRHEAAAERNFFRALKELRQLKGDAQAAEPVVAAPTTCDEMGSFLRIEREVARLEARMSGPAASVPVPRIPADLTGLGRRVDVPISIGRRR